VRERIGGSTSYKTRRGFVTATTPPSTTRCRTRRWPYDLKSTGRRSYSGPSGAGFTGYGYDRESFFRAGEPYLRDTSSWW